MQEEAKEAVQGWPHAAGKARRAAAGVGALGACSLLPPGDGGSAAKGGGHAASKKDSTDAPFSQEVSSPPALCPRFEK